MIALMLVLVIGLTGCSNVPNGLSGNYAQDTLAVITTLRTAIELPDDSPERPAAQAQARQIINDFSSQYRRNGSYTKLSSFTTMRTALNSLAGYYSSYPNRPLPQKLKDRLELEFDRIESALRREG
jgi:photosystem II Psb27 protein